MGRKDKTSKEGTDEERKMLRSEKQAKIKIIT